MYLLAREFEKNEKIVEFYGIRLFRKKIRINYSNRYCIKLIPSQKNERADILVKKNTNPLDIFKTPFTDLSEVFKKKNACKHSL